MSTNETPRLPLRGIAMIIIAVAVLLLAWGVYSMTNSGSEQATVAHKAAESTAAPAAPAPSAVPNTPATAHPATTPAASTAQTAAAPAVGASPKIFALNNSTVQGLANRVADDLKKKGYTDIESGNFPDQVLPKSVAFFTPGNAAEEATARQIADQLKITAEPRIDALKNKPAGVVVVITGDLNR